MKYLYRLLLKFYWFFTDKCTECGGDIEEHINGKFYCNVCGAKN